MINYKNNDNLFNIFFIRVSIEKAADLVVVQYKYERFINDLGNK